MERKLKKHKKYHTQDSADLRVPHKSVQYKN